MQRTRIVRALEELPLFAWAVSRVDASLPAREWPPAPVARVIKSKPAPPPAQAIWKRRRVSCADAQSAFLKALRGGAAPTPLPQRIADGVLACPRIALAIGRPEVAPAKLVQSGAWISHAADRITLELAYHGPKEHLAEALAAAARVGRDLKLIVRETTANYSPLRADTAKKGLIGWRVSVVMVEPPPAQKVAAFRTQEHAATMAA